MLTWIMTSVPNWSSASVFAASPECWPSSLHSLPSGPPPWSSALVEMEATPALAGKGRFLWAKGQPGTLETPGKGVVSRWEWRRASQKRDFLSFFVYVRFYLFIHERDREAETQAEGEAGSLWSLMQDSIPGPQDHDLSQRQMLKPLKPPRHPWF